MNLVAKICGFTRLEVARWIGLGQETKETRDAHNGVIGLKKVFKFLFYLKKFSLF